MFSVWAFKDSVLSGCEMQLPFQVWVYQSKISSFFFFPLHCTFKNRNCTKQKWPPSPQNRTREVQQFRSAAAKSLINRVTDGEVLNFYNLSFIGNNSTNNKPDRSGLFSVIRSTTNYELFFWGTKKTPHTICTSPFGTGGKLWWKTHWSTLCSG